ncbi:uncharacterized protein LOC144422194 [Styela clava]
MKTSAILMMKSARGERRLFVAAVVLLEISLLVCVAFLFHWNLVMMIFGQLFSIAGTTAFAIFDCRINFKEIISEEHAKSHTKRYVTKLKFKCYVARWLGIILLNVVPWIRPNIPAESKKVISWLYTSIATFVMTWTASFRLSKLLSNDVERKFLEIAFPRQTSMHITLHYALLILSCGIGLFFFTFFYSFVSNSDIDDLSISWSTLMLAWLGDIICMNIMAAISLIRFINLYRKKIRKINEELVKTEQMKMSLLNTSTHNIETKITCIDHVIHFDPDVSYQQGNLAISKMTKPDSFNLRRASLSIIESQARTNRLHSTIPNYFVSLQLPLNSQQTPPQSKDSISIFSTACSHSRISSSYSSSVPDLRSVGNRISTSIPNLSVSLVLSRLPINSQQASLTISNFSTASLRTDLMSLNNSLPSSDANFLSQANDDSEASSGRNISSNHDNVEFDAWSTEGNPSSISVPSEGLTNTDIHTMSAMFHQPRSSYSSSDLELWSARNLISISIPGPILSQSLNANLCSFPLNDQQESPRSSETISSFATPSMRSDNMSSNNSLPSSGANSQSRTTDDSGASSGSNISSNYDRVEVDAWSGSMSSLNPNGGSSAGYSSLNDADANQ